MLFQVTKTEQYWVLFCRKYKMELSEKMITSSRLFSSSKTWMTNCLSTSLGANPPGIVCSRETLILWNPRACTYGVQWAAARPSWWIYSISIVQYLMSTKLVFIFTVSCLMSMLKFTSSSSESEVTINSTKETQLPASRSWFRHAPGYSAWTSFRSLMLWMQWYWNNCSLISSTRELYC